MAMINPDALPKKASRITRPRYRRGPIIAVDFDGVIHDQADRLPGRRMGAPFPDAPQALRQLNDSGYSIVIHTCRATSVSGRESVREWFEFYDLPFDEITAIKPNAEYYIDNKAIRHISWAQTLGSINLIPEVT